MTRTRFSLFYLAGYLIPAGLLLLLAPTFSTRLLLSNGDYGDVFPRLAGIRPIRPDDAARLQAFHQRLSAESIYLRWLSAHPVLTDEEAAAMTQLDYSSRMAFVAVVPTAGPGPDREASVFAPGEIIGVA